LRTLRKLAFTHFATASRVCIRTFALARLYSLALGYTALKFSCRWTHERRTTGWSHRVKPPASTRDSIHWLSCSNVNQLG